MLRRRLNACDAICGESGALGPRRAGAGGRRKVRGMGSGPSWRAEAGWRPPLSVSGLTPAVPLHPSGWISLGSETGCARSAVPALRSAVRRVDAAVCGLYIPDLAAVTRL